MVEVALHQRLGTVYMGSLEREVVTHYIVGIAVAMGLVVGLIHDVDAPTVTEFVEVFAVGIVRGAQEVDVGLFHQADILLVGGIINVTASLRMMVVTVHAAQLHVLAVDLKDFANNLDLLHTQMVVEMLDSIALVVLQFHAEGIEIRLLRRPEQWFLYSASQLDSRCVARKNHGDWLFCEQGALRPNYRVPVPVILPNIQYRLQILRCFLARIAKRYPGADVCL